MPFKKEVVNILKKEKISEDLIQSPPNPEMGDYALPCFTLVKKYKKSPQDIAKILQSKLHTNKCIKRIEANGPYLNFFIDKSQYNKSIIESKFKRFKVKKTIIVEYSSPNIMKPFSVAHLRSTMIGNSIANIYDFLGYKVIRINHLGDWGTQFGKMCYAFTAWGNKKDLNKNPIKYMLSLYVKFHKEAEKDPSLEDRGREWFARLEKGDKTAKAFWSLFRSLSLKEYSRLYKRLNVKFNSVTGESFYEPYLKPTIELLKKKSLVERSDNALIVDLKPLTPCILQKSDGSSIYATRDIAAAIYRAKTYHFDENLYVVDTRQSLHFQQVFKVLELAGFPWYNHCKHINFGVMKFNDDVMSTRQGKIIFLEDLLDESVSSVKSIIQQKNPKLKNKDKVAEQVGLGAIIFWDLSHDRILDINFDWEKVLDFNGETAPYLQYTYARASSILRKVKNSSKPNYSKLIAPEELGLIKQLSLFDDALKNASNQYKPSIIAKYLLVLARKFNDFYQNCHCNIVGDAQLVKARLNLVKKTKEILSLGLGFLGIVAPEEM